MRTCTLWGIFATLVSTPLSFLTSQGAPSCLERRSRRYWPAERTPLVERTSLAHTKQHPQRFQIQDTTGSTGHTAQAKKRRYREISGAQRPATKKVRTLPLNKCCAFASASMLFSRLSFCGPRPWGRCAGETLAGLAAGGLAAYRINST